MSWQSGLEENDYIIPDEEEQTPRESPASTETHNQTQKPRSVTSSFPWAPRVDLSSAFTSFVASKNFQNTNKISERRFNGGDTLDEPVLTTLKRDLWQIGRRVAVVVWPAQLQNLARLHQARLAELAAENGIRLPLLVADSFSSIVPEEDDETQPQEVVASLDWDLWGPLIFLLAYAVTMGVAAPQKQTNVVFSGTFLFMWLFYLVVGLNIQLLGGTISFLSAISATGYLTFPIVAGELLSTLFLKWRVVRLMLMAVCAVWSVYAAIMSLKCLGVLPGRVFLAIYPVALMYSVLSWLVVIT